jgi:Ser/Thr protein kinase RdoA (MazF antagonist)
MGIKSTIRLTEAQKLFENFHLTQLLPTHDGVMDTTYIALANNNAYILKKYERDISHKIAFDTKLLNELSRKGLNVPKLLATNNNYYLYTKLKGKSPKRAQLHHLQILGRFIAKLHQETKKHFAQRDFFENYSLQTLTQKYKTEYFYYYKKLASLTPKSSKTDGFIHGDIFKDNTLFDSNKIALFDFIDGGDGSFAFELGVILLSFNPSSRKSYTQILLQCYNQHAPRKIALEELKYEQKRAAQLYALLRLERSRNPKDLKELVKLC